MEKFAQNSLIINNDKWLSLWSRLYAVGRNDIVFAGNTSTKSLFIIIRNVQINNKWDSLLLEEAYDLCLDLNWHNIIILENPEVICYEPE